MRALTLISALLLVGWATPPVQPSSSTDPDIPPQDVTLHIVRMVGYTYEPAELTVNPGDTVRFIQEGTMPHNVQFTGMPQGVDLGAAVMGPYLLTVGDTYDLVIGEGFSTGSYDYVCTPHASLDMKGSIQVAELM